jgi:hypothetical protein
MHALRRKAVAKSSHLERSGAFERHFLQSQLICHCLGWFLASR